MKRENKIKKRKEKIKYNFNTQKRVLKFQKYLKIEYFPIFSIKNTVKDEPTRQAFYTQIAMCPTSSEKKY